MYKYLESSYGKYPIIKFALQILITFAAVFAWHHMDNNQSNNVEKKNQDIILTNRLINFHTILEETITGHSISPPQDVFYAIQYQLANRTTDDMKLFHHYYDKYIAPLEANVKLAYAEDEAKFIAIKLTAEDKTALLKGNPVDLSKYGVSFDMHRLKVARALEEILLDNMRKALMEDPGKHNTVFPVENAS